MNSPTLLTTLLKNVSRSFYLTLRALPPAIRPQIGLAYLLARATDTIADTELVPAAERLAALRAFKARILEHGAAPLEFQVFASRQHNPSEKTLLEQSEAALAILRDLPTPDKTRIQEVLTIITDGQELDLLRFGTLSSGQLSSLATDEELDDYTYRVAGCVGEFWTKMCLAHLRTPKPLDEASLLRTGILFGRGLQLVNILRDIPADLKQGRCYIPSERLQKIGLRPADLLDPANSPKFQPLYLEYLRKAESFLEAGWLYTNTLPRGWVRVRLACAWPILIGVQTLGKLRVSVVLDPAQRVKINRAEVRQIILRSLWSYPSKTAWEGLYRKSKA